MGKQIFNIKGMMRDLDPAKSPNQYAYEIRNLRLTAQEDSTLLALTTEKGNTQYTLTGSSIAGNIVGYCVLNKYITIFTHGTNADYIYRLEEDTTAASPTMIVTSLYSGDLDFDNGTKIEALGVYENENIQKVYWIDGVNQPRTINIIDTTTDYTNRTTPFDFIPVTENNEIVNVQKMPYSGNFSAGTIQYILTYYNKNGQQSNAFYVSPLFYVAPSSRGGSPEETINNAFQVTIKNPNTEFDFIRVYSVQRTSKNGTPICKKVKDLRINNSSTFQVNGLQRVLRATSLTTPNLFTNVSIHNLDNIKLFTGQAGNLKNSNAKPLSDYLVSASGNTRTYTIPGNLYLHYFSNTTLSELNYFIDYVYHNTSGFTFTINTETMKLSTPSTIKCGRSAFSESSYSESIAGLSVVDNGLNNETVDFAEVLYAGGTAIIPNTLEQKSNTLFFGNYSYKSSPLTETQIASITKGVTITFANSDKSISKGTTGSYYMYQSQFDKSEKEITTFKGGETYRFGFILYNNLGEKTPVIDLGEVTNNYYPRDFDTEFLPVKAYVNLPLANIAYIKSLGYVSIQCVVRENQNYKVVAQGALCPTLYKMNDRKNGNMFSVSSWFFRDLQLNTREDYIDAANQQVIARRNSFETLYYKRTDPYSYTTNPTTPGDWNVITKIIHNHRVRGTQNVHNQNIANFIDRQFFVSNPLYDWVWKAMPDGEIMGASESDISAYDPRREYTDMDFFVDWGTLTFHSPEIEFEEIGELGNTYNLRIVGLLPITGVITKHILETKDGSTPYHIGIENFVEEMVWYSNIQQGGYQTSLSTYCWQDGKSGAENGVNYYPIFPWQRNASLNGSQVSISGSEDWRGLLGYNIRSSIRTSARTFFIEQHQYAISKAAVYHDDANVVSLGNDTNIPSYTENRLYSGEVQEALTSSSSYSIHYSDYYHNEITASGHTAPIQMKYKSKPHAVFSLGYNSDRKQVILPSLDLGDNNIVGEMPTSTVYPMWQTGNAADFTADGVIAQDQIDVSDLPASYKGYGFIYLAELVQQNSSIIKDGIWNIGGQIQKLLNSQLAIEVSYGDTYYQRYDCLKTYPFSLEDQNQVIEIFSFMCETRVNIDGRYDSRRGQSDNTTVNNTNFNLINKAYTQEDNFITYSYLDPEDYSVNDFPNQLIWTKNKVYGSDIDAWTQIIPTSTLDMDGTAGEVKALKLWNDNLMCFQDRGIAKIMYNERTTISTQQGVPIEIANSGKVDGSQYISNQIGCTNKDSIQVTQDGIYFIDSNTKEIYRWAKGLESLSKSKGFNTYLYNNSNLDTEKTFYDPKLKDVYFEFGSECLVYNEQLAEFTSFLDYDMKFMFPFKDSLVAIKNNTLWEQFAGNYLSFFGSNKGYSVEIISAEKPTEDKIFSTVEFRADVLDNDNHLAARSDAGTGTGQSDFASYNKLPFDSIRAWNEYQDTGHYDNANSVWVDVALQSMIRRGANMSQKFRIWRADIPRVYGKPLERIRNPWARIKLSDAGGNKKTVIHDIGVTYF